MRLLSFPDYATPIGIEIGRALRGEHEYGADVMQLLYVANRYEWKNEILRERDAGTILVCDRYLASSVAYGEAHGLDGAWLPEIQRHLPQPDLTFLLDIPPDVSARRKTADRDKYERDLSLLGRVRESYLRQASDGGWLRLDADRDRAEVGDERVRRGVCAVAGGRDRATDVKRRPQGGSSRHPWLPGSAERHHICLGNARAAVSARTSRAPASFSTCAHASSVAPVVLTSSTSTTTRPRTNRDAGAPRQERRQAKCPPDVAPPRGCGEARLRHRRARPPEGMEHRPLEPAREVGRLVETALHPPEGMQRHRDDGIRAGEDGGAVAAHHRGERHGERASPVVLERVDDLAKGPVVSAARAAAVNPCGLKRDGSGARWSCRIASTQRDDLRAAATCAQRHRQADDAPRRKGVATGDAERRLERMDSGPARRAHRTAERGIEDPLAHDAVRRQEGRDQGVGGVREERYASSENSCRSALPQRRSRS